MTNKKTKYLVLSALLLALGQVLPFITGQIPEIGKMLSPMHIPVLLCGFTCGPIYGALVGFICPLLRSVLFGMPKMFPNAVAMAFELLTYGVASGYFYSKLKDKNVVGIYACLIGAMLLGRVVWGVVEVILLGSAFTWQLFMAGAFLNAIPGIILHLVLIPILVVSLQKAHLMD